MRKRLPLSPHKGRAKLSSWFRPENW
jgi:hypothetical protein